MLGSSAAVVNLSRFYFQRIWNEVKKYPTPSLPWGGILGPNGAETAKCEVGKRELSGPFPCKVLIRPGSLGLNGP